MGIEQSLNTAHVPFDCWIVGQIEEKSDSVQRSILFEVRLEEPGRFHVDTHSCKDYRKVVFMTIEYTLSRTLDETGLTTDLGCNLWTVLRR
jgi:hypothetical protein